MNNSESKKDYKSYQKLQIVSTYKLNGLDQNEGLYQQPKFIKFLFQTVMRFYSNKTEVSQLYKKQLDASTYCLQQKKKPSPCVLQRQEQKSLLEIKETKNQTGLNKFRNKIPNTEHRAANYQLIYKKGKIIPLQFFCYVIILFIMFVVDLEAITCFNDKMPVFIMDEATSNSYVWQTVIKTKDDRFLFKGGYVKIDSTTQTAFPGAPFVEDDPEDPLKFIAIAIAGLFDTLTQIFVWVKVFVDENESSPIISAIALNYNEDTLVLAGTSTDSKKSFYFFVHPKSGAIKYPSFTVQHGQDFHFLTSQSILIAGASRIYCSGISMKFDASYTLECANIGQTCSGTESSLTSPDAIQYLVIDYATQTILWHKIANSQTHFGAGQMACLIDVNPTASLNGQENVIMGGGFSPVISGAMTQWKTALISINATTGQLDLVKGLTPQLGNSNFAIPTADNYPIIVHLYLYQTVTQWSIFYLAQSRLMSTGGSAYKRQICQINFFDDSYSTVISTICRDFSLGISNKRKEYGPGIKYDPTEEYLHFIAQESSFASSTTSNDYIKVNLVTGAYQANVIYNSFFSNAGVFTNKALVTLSNGYKVNPGYFVGQQKTFTNVNFPSATPTATLTFTKNSAVTYPFDRYETCIVETLAAYGTSVSIALTNIASTNTSLPVGQQSNQNIITRLYKTIDLQFQNLRADNLCGSSSYTPLTISPGSFHNINLYNDSSTLYQCPFKGITYNISCQDSNEQVYSIDESNIANTKCDVFRADGANLKINMQIQNQTVEAQINQIKVTSTLPSGQSASFTFCVNFLQGLPPPGYIACDPPTCLTDVDTITVLSSNSPPNFTYVLGQSSNNLVTIQEFTVTSLDDSCASLCTATDIVYNMTVTSELAGQSTDFISFDAMNRIVDWTTTNISDVGSFIITITGGIYRYPSVSSHSDSVSFLLIISAQETSYFKPIELLNGKMYNNSQIEVCNMNSDTLEIGPVQVFDPNEEFQLKYKINPQSNYFYFDYQSANLNINRKELRKQIDQVGTLLFDVQITLESSLYTNFTQKYRLNFIFNNYSCPVDMNQQNQSVKIPNELRPYFKSLEINNQGLVKVYFSELIIIPTNNSSFRQLSPSQFNQSILDVSIVQPFSGDQKYFNFTWNATNFTATYIQLQLNFERPLYISAQGPYLSDQLKVQVIDTSFFISKSHNYPIIEDFYVICDIPSQLSNNKNANEIFLESMQVAGKLADTILSTSLILNLLLAASMSMLWGSINALQIIAYLVYFKLYFPANVQIFFQAILKISNFDMIPATQIFETIFPQLKQNNVEQKNIKVSAIEQKIGTFLLFLFILVAIFPLYFLFKYLKKNYTFVEGVFIKIRDTLFWNLPLRYIMESYLSLTLFAFSQIFITGLDWSSGLLILSSIFALICIVIFVIIPIPITWFFRKNVKNYPHKHFQNKFGDITKNFYWRSSNASNFIPIFCYRRLIQVLLIVFAAKYPFAQIQLITVTCQISIVVFGYSDVMTLPISRRLEYFNEFMILIAIYHMFLFTDFVPDPEIRYQIGYSFIIFTCFTCFINFSITFMHTIQAVCVFYKQIRQWYRVLIINERINERNKKNEESMKQLEQLKQQRIKQWRETGTMDDNEDPQLYPRQKRIVKPPQKPLNQINEEQQESEQSIDSKRVHNMFKDSNRPLNIKRKNSIQISDRIKNSSSSVIESSSSYQSSLNNEGLTSSLSSYNRFDEVSGGSSSKSNLIIEGMTEQVSPIDYNKGLNEQSSPAKFNTAEQISPTNSTKFNIGMNESPNNNKFNEFTGDEKFASSLRFSVKFEEWIKNPFQQEQTEDKSYVKTKLKKFTTGYENEIRDEPKALKVIKQIDFLKYDDPWNKFYQSVIQTQQQEFQFEGDVWKPQTEQNTFSLNISSEQKQFQVDDDIWKLHKEQVTKLIESQNKDYLKKEREYIDELYKNVMQ